MDMLKIATFAHCYSRRAGLSVFITLLLLLAAPGILAQENDGDIGAPATDVNRMIAIKSGLHRNIQDMFNEYGVQIMSPAYESDPQTPKVVPPENWYAAPASKSTEK